MVVKIKQSTLCRSTVVHVVVQLLIIFIFTCPTIAEDANVIITGIDLQFTVGGITVFEEPCNSIFPCLHLFLSLYK